MTYEEIVTFWQEQRIRTGEGLIRAIGEQGVLNAYHSGRIENPAITFENTKEIFLNDSVSNYTGDIKTLFEIRNARDAHELFLVSFGKRRVLDEAMILTFHLALNQNTYDKRRLEVGERPGTYKQHDYVTGKFDVGAAPEDVHEEIEELLLELKDITPDEVLTAAAYFHAKFENIHPFADGNGRVGRLMMNYLLIIHDYPPLIIFEEDRGGYYAALEAWDEKQDLEPLKAFLRTQTVKTWEGAAKR